MPTLAEQADELAALLGGATATDLPALGRAHEQLEQLARAVAQEGAVAPGLSGPLTRAGAEAKQLLEGIMLRDVADADAALCELAGRIAGIRQLVNGAEGPAAPAGADLPPPARAGVAQGEEPLPPALPAEAAIAPDDHALVREFIGEALGHVESAETHLLRLEQGPGDRDAVAAVFRGFHTIKGVAGFLNLRQIGALAHAAENLLDLAREGKLEISGRVADLVLESADAMRASIGSLDEALAQSVPPAARPGLPALIRRLHAVAAGGPPGPANGPAPAPPAPVRAAPAPPAGPANEPPAAARPEDPAERVAPTPAERRQRDRRSADAASAGAGGGTAGAGDGSVKVSTERLDGLINMVGELVIAQSMVSQDIAATAALAAGNTGGHGNQRLVRNLAHLAKITRELQDLSMAMRMVPIQGTFQKMTRLVRDLAHKAGKQVELAIAGGETELDRNVVEAISDPLVHMVRNSVDHGLEPPEERLRAGKAPTGRVELRAEHKAGNILIEIRDDGRGLNPQKILRKAVEAGIVKEGQEPGEQEVLRLIFHAGLSTAEKVTDVSGRGVGMDVVKRNVEALRGRIDIASVPGRGATFSIRLPLTLAVIDGLLVRVGAERYILPITSIEQSVRPTAGQVSTVQGRGEVCLMRGALLPLFRLHRLFGVTPSAESPERALVVIVRDNDRICCLLVDELLGQQQVVIKSLGERIGAVPGVSGGAILGDGNVSLILDVPGLIDLATAA